MTALDRFVDSLLRVSRRGTIIDRYRLGVALLHRQIKKIRARIKTRKLPVSGFREDLVAHGQGGEMYRHLHFHLACYLLGPLGKLLSWGVGQIDHRQLAKGRQESQTEILNNVAGRECGKILLKYLKNQLDSSQTRAELCKLLAA